MSVHTMDPLYSIRPTPYGGRGVHARTDISAGTCILRCPGPYTYAFEHGKRVWSWPWKYESTQSTHPINPRDQQEQECIRATISAIHNPKQKKGKGAPNTAANLAGSWFCTAECRTRWCLEMDFRGLHASLLGMLEKLHLTASDKKRGSADIPVTAADSITIEGDSFPLLKTLQPYWIHSNDALLSASHHKNSTLSAGSEEQISNSHHDQTLSCQMQLDIVWSHAELVYARGYQRNAAPCKSRNEGSLSEFELDTARFVISALAQFFWEGSAAAQSTRGLDQNETLMIWTDMLELQNNEIETALRKPEILATQLRVYGFVRSVVETALKTPGVMPAGAYDWGRLRTCVEKSDYVRAILGRDHGNVFGIWDMATEGDSEMLGWAMYIQGSYFNHDCSPNVKKQRVGRSLEFYAMRSIAAGEELCTTYIDVDEPVNHRQAELREQWYFDCACVRCCKELQAAEEGGEMVPFDKGFIDSGYVSSVTS